MNIKILLVEDDINLGTILKEFLVLKGYSVSHALDGEKGINIFLQQSFNLIILDIMMPNLDGFSTAKQIRKLNDTIPIIFLTAKSMLEDKVEGFTLGADDYITKPFSTEELLLRIQAVLKRTAGNQNSGLEMRTLGKFIFDYKKRILKFNKEEQKLTSREAELLNLLCINANNITHRTEALNSIWGDDSYFTARSMDVYITKLRGYLRRDEKIEIINVHGTGYKLIIP